MNNPKNPRYQVLDETAGVGRAVPGLPGGKFGAILADPPIPFTTWSRKGEGRSPQHHYRCEAFDELAAVPVASVAADDCFLFLWIPLRSVFLVEPLMRAWGFTFSGSAFGWAKQSRSGVGWFMGCGYGTRHNLEICWLGRRGKPQRKSAGVRELIVAPVREHSRKPDTIYSGIEAFCDGPWLELYARQQWPGWTCVGDEANKFLVKSENFQSSAAATPREKPTVHARTVSDS